MSGNVFKGISDKLGKKKGMKKLRKPEPMPEIEIPEDETVLAENEILIDFDEVPLPDLTIEEPKPEKGPAAFFRKIKLKKEQGDKEPKPPKEKKVKEPKPPKEKKVKEPKPPKEKKVKEPKPPREKKVKEPKPPKEKKVKEPKNRQTAAKVAPGVPEVDDNNIVDAEAAAFSQNVPGGKALAKKLTKAAAPKKRFDKVRLGLIIGLIVMTLLLVVSVIFILVSEDYLYLEELPFFSSEDDEDDEDEEDEDDEDDEDDEGGAWGDRVSDLQEQLEEANQRNSDLQDKILEILDASYSGARNTDDEDADEDDWDSDDWSDEDEPVEEEPEEEDTRNRNEDEDEDDDDWDDEDEDEDEDDDDWDDEDEDTTSKSSSSSSSAPSSSGGPHTMTDREGTTATFTAEEWSYLVGLYKNTKNPTAVAEDHTIAELRYLLSRR